MSDEMDDMKREIAELQSDIIRILVLESANEELEKRIAHLEEMLDVE